MNRELIKAAQALIDRWDSPLWKEVEHTGAYIARLRKALSQAEHISRSELIDILLATRGLSEGVTADAILAAMRSASVPQDVEEIERLTRCLAKANDQTENFERLYYLAQQEAEAGKEKLAQWMIIRSIATGHGDTIDDLIAALNHQVVVRSVSKDVEEFIHRHGYKRMFESGTEYCVEQDDLRAWMAGHARVPVEPDQAMLDVSSELLAALKTFVDAWSDESGFSNPSYEDVQKAFSVIAKAEKQNE